MVFIPQETDTHWRCYRGKGCWNWRCKFTLTLPMATPEMGRLHMQLWDRDVAKWNDVICEGQIDLFPWLLEAYQRKDDKETYMVRPFLEQKERMEIEELKREGLLDESIGGAGEGESDSLLQGGSSSGGGGGGAKKRRPSSKVMPDGDGGMKAAIDKARRTKKLREGSSGGDAKKGGTSKDEGDQQAMHAIKQFKDFVGVGDIPDDADWIGLHCKDDNGNGNGMEEAGKLCMSVMICPEAKAELRPNGLGRDDPNAHPYLPPPVGRMEMSFNPISMLRQLCGPEIFCKFCCCIGCLAGMVLMAVFGSMITPFIVLLK